MTIYIDAHQDLFVITLHMFGFNSWDMIVITKWRASASEAGLIIAFHLRFCYIYIYIYIYVRTLRKQVLQLCKLDGCTLRRMVYSSAGAQHAPQWFLRSAALLHRQSTASQSAFIVAGTLPHSAVRWCNAQWPAVQRPYHSQIHTQSSPSHKCWMTCCWFTK